MPHTLDKFLIEGTRMDWLCQFLIQTLAGHVDKCIFPACCFVDEVDGCRLMAKEESGSGWQV